MTHKEMQIDHNFVEAEPSVLPQADPVASANVSHAHSQRWLELENNRLQ